MYPNNSGLMQNRNRKTKETITQETQRFTWFGLSLHPWVVSRKAFTNKGGRLQ